MFAAGKSARLRFESLNQFRHRLTSVRNQILRTACEIRDGYLADVNAKVLIKRGEDFAKLHGPFHRFAAQTIRRGDDPASMWSEG